MPVSGSAGVPAGINPAKGRRFQGAGEDAGAPRGISGKDEGASHFVIAPDKIGFKNNHCGIAKTSVARVERNSVSVLHRMQKGGTWIALRKLRSIQATLAYGLTVLLLPESRAYGWRNGHRTWDFAVASGLPLNPGHSSCSSRRSANQTGGYPASDSQAGGTVNQPSS